MINISFTDDSLDGKVNKTLAQYKNGQLFLSNVVDIKYICFFKDLLPEFTEIVYFEDEKPVCPHCGCEMNSNGSKEAHPNKLDGILKKQYICPDCGKTLFTSLEPFISKYHTFSNDICEKGLDYDYIDRLSYGKKRELIVFENDVKIARSTIHYHETIFSEQYIKRQEELNLELLEMYGIEPTGYYCYDEQYPHEDGNQLVRLSIIDAINNLPINELIVYKEDFDKDLLESFLESSLSGLPKEAMITDGLSMYPDIIDKMGMKHQLCIFHIIKNHHSKTYKSIAKLSRRIRTIQKQMASNKATIAMLNDEIKNNNFSKSKINRKRKKIKKREIDNKNLRKERRKKKDELNDLLKTNECVENIYKADDKKGSSRRRNTLHNRREFLNKNSKGFLENLDKKFDRTTAFYDDPNIPRTNNGIERYFGITLPRNMKRKFRTLGGLTRWLSLQKIRWVRRNVLHAYEVKNISLTQHLQDKINESSGIF